MIKIENLQYHRSDYFFAIDTYFIKMQGRERDATFFFNSAFSLIQTEKKRGETNKCSEWTPRENSDSSQIFQWFL